jgi:hypothetical protein
MRAVDRMVELTVALGHYGEPNPSNRRPYARCGRHRGHGQKWCAACRPLARKEYNQDYHRRTYQPKSAPEVSAARRSAVRQRRAK